MGEILWTPQAKQAEFMERDEFEVFYGGAAGGGKSDALVVEALRQVHIPHYRGLLVRKTFPECRELIDKSLWYYKKAYPKARYNATEHRWTFPTGARIDFGSLQHEQDKIKYQGQAFDYIGLDELTHFLQSEYDFLKSRCRPNGEGTVCYVRSTGNPGGIGHQWVKDRFITAGPPKTTIWDWSEWYEPDGRRVRKKLSRCFIPSSIFDNDALMKNDPMYVARLAALPEAERNAFLYGDWNTFSGQVFREWKDDPDHYADRIGTHVINPFEIPSTWGVWCGMDWGYSRPYAIGWFAVDPDGRIYHIRELYGCTGTPNQGVHEEPAVVSDRIAEIEEQDPNLKGKRIQRVGDPAIWGTQGTQSIGDIFDRRRQYFNKGNNSRIDGKMQLHHRLAMDENGIPMMYIFNTCKNFIRTLPSLVYDEKKVEDIDTRQEDHAYDMCRYVLMDNPMAPPIYKERKYMPPTPFDTDVHYDNYSYFAHY